MMNHSFLKIGHRGAKGYLAENTLESIQKAIDLGVDGIEIDVHCCASGQLVVFHDFTLGRMTNGSGEIAKSSLKKLKNLEVNGGFKIPTLDEVVEHKKKKCLLNIELKGRHTALKTCELIDNYIIKKGWNYTDFLVSSFQHSELETVHKFNNKIPLAVLTKANVEEAIAFAKTINAVAIHPDFAVLTPDNVKLAQAKNFKVNTWTVNDNDTIKRMKTYGVNGIISDVPDRL